MPQNRSCDAGTSFLTGFKGTGWEYELATKREFQSTTGQFISTGRFWQNGSVGLRASDSGSCLASSSSLPPFRQDIGSRGDETALWILIKPRQNNALILSRALRGGRNVSRS